MDTSGSGTPDPQVAKERIDQDDEDMAFYLVLEDGEWTRLRRFVKRIQEATSKKKKNEIATEAVKFLSNAKNLLSDEDFYPLCVLLNNEELEDLEGVINLAAYYFMEEDEQLEKIKEFTNGNILTRLKTILSSDTLKDATTLPRAVELCVQMSAMSTEEDVESLIDTYVGHYYSDLYHAIMNPDDESLLTIEDNENTEANP